MDVFSLLWPAAFAALVAVGVTVLVERLGGLVGGLLGTLPTTIVPAALGIHAEAGGGEGFVQAMYATPPGMLVNALFLLVWRLLPPRLPKGRPRQRLALVVLVSLGAWLAGALALLALLSRLSASLPVALFAAALLLVVGLWTSAQGPQAARAARRVGPTVLVARGLGAGLAILAAVALARTGEGLLAGVAAVFPAIFLTTMLGLSLAHGDAVPAGAVGPMMVGSVSVAAFALLAVPSCAALGVGPGALVAWLAAAFGVQLPLFFLVRALLGRRLSSAAR